MIAEYFEEIRSALINLCYRTDKQKFVSIFSLVNRNCMASIMLLFRSNNLTLQEESLREEYKNKWRQISLPSISKFLGTNTFLLGSDISYVDFILHELLYVHGLFDAAIDLRVDFPNLADFIQNFEVPFIICGNMKNPIYLLLFLFPLIFRFR